MKNATLRVFPQDKKGPVHRLNGVGGGPCTYIFSYDASPYFKAAKIPFCRTHDIEQPYGAGQFVDIHNLFPNFDSDENDPKSYNFTFTDEYMQCIDAVGAKPLYRLGNSIEHHHTKLFVHPPKDFAKWGRICSHIIAHYNEGWANGFRLGIEYWEIWNEPDIGPCWTGTQEQFLDLYAAAAPIIKKDHPGIKLGGIAFADVNGPMVDAFLSRCRKEGLPLDFVSWHAYIHLPEQTAVAAAKMRAKMDEYGFGALESVYDEWNYAVNWGRELQKSVEFHYTVGEAAFMGAVMTTAQKSGVDIACYYDAQMLMEQEWNGVFCHAPRGEGGVKGKQLMALPGYFALQYWGELYGMTTVETSCDVPTVYTTAAVSDDGCELKLMIANFSDEAGYGSVPPEGLYLTVDAEQYEVESVRMTDAFGNNQPMVLVDGTIEFNAYALALVTMRKKQ